MATKNKVCCVLCRKEITANNIKNHHNSKVCIAPKIQSEFNKDNSCMFCGKIYKNKLAISKHQPYCVRNPNRSDKPFRTASPIHRTEEYRESQRQIRLKNSYIYEDSAFIEKQRQNSLAYYTDPLAREKTANAMRLAVLNNPESYSSKNIGGRVKSYVFNGMTFKGTWELAFAKYLVSNNIPFIQPLSIPYIDANGKTRQYFPDFLLTETNEYVEVKGFIRDKDYFKWNASDKPLFLLMKSEITQINNGDFNLNNLLLWKDKLNCLCGGRGGI